MDPSKQSLRPFLDSTGLGVHDRRVFTASREERPVSTTGRYRARRQRRRPERNAVINASMRAQGRAHGRALAKMSAPSRKRHRDEMEARTTEIHDGFARTQPHRDRLNKRAKLLVSSSAAPTATRFRNVEKGQDEPVASAPSASYLTGLRLGINQSTASVASRNDALRVAESAASALSALRFPTSVAQARDDQGSGLAHPSNRATNKHRPKGGAGAHDTGNRERAAAVVASMASRKSSEVSQSVILGTRVAAAASANSFAMYPASNFKSTAPKQTRAAQARTHEQLKRISGSVRGRTQSRTAKNRSHRGRSVSPERK
ncbi:MAG: hypothetical protein JKX81_10585 [Arenicella sp.]|nr:hypothetical protein [Arenicella sp.]